MAKSAATRMQDTLREVSRILGPEPFHHILGHKVPAPGTPLYTALSGQLSLGNTVSKGTARRHAIRAYALLLYVLENRGAAYVQNRIQMLETNNEPIGRIEGFCRGAWQTYDQTVDCATLSARTQALGNNPLALLRAYPVLPCNGAIRQDASLDYDLVTLNGAAPNPTTVRMLLTPSGANEHTFKLTYAPTTKQNQGIPVHFLPWKSGRIVRMTIPVGGGPSLFFTAAINGCSVFVEGPRNNPTVYHAGITPPWPAMGANCNAHVQAAKLANNVPLTWRELFWQHALHSARGGNNFGEVNKTHYITDGTVSAAGVDTTARADAFDQHIRVAWAAPPHNLTVTQCLPWGCVFGVRNLNNWSFYLQENVTILFTDAGGANWATSRLIRLTCFYPTLALNYHVPGNYRAAPAAVASDNVLRL